MASKGISRRRFLGQSLAAAGAFTIVPRWVLGGPGNTPPSEKLRHAVIGVGGMGGGHVGYALGDPQAVLLACCDPDAGHLDANVKRGGSNCKGILCRCY